MRMNVREIHHHAHITAETQMAAMTVAVEMDTSLVLMVSHVEVNYKLPYAFKVLKEMDELQ